MSVAANLLDTVFGSQGEGTTPEDRAASSTQRFIRSQHQVSKYRAGATGRILNAQEALRLVGWDILQHLHDQVAVPILVNPDEPYNSINNQMNRLGLRLSEVAKTVRWSKETIKRYERRQQVPFRELERIARVLDLESDLLGLEIDAGADAQTSVRLRTFKSSDPRRFTAHTVLSLAEAAWTIRKQIELAGLTGNRDSEACSKLGFEPTDAFGTFQVRTYSEGYRLAKRARELLGINPDAPIRSIKELIEGRLRIPVIQCEIHSELAGATVSSGSARGIVINLKGANANPLARRMTMAHELGHLLWDPDHKLNKLVVDRYDTIDSDAVPNQTPLDVVERRANAFAIEFLAPGDAILAVFNDSGGDLRGLMSVIETFGISRLAAVNHLRNSSFNEIELADFHVPRISVDEWEASELVALPLFNPQSVPVSRRGRFAYYVYAAHQEKLISDDTAASLFSCSPEQLPLALNSARDLIGGQ